MFISPWEQHRNFLLNNFHLQVFVCELEKRLQSYFKAVQ
jgi:hypothetical protein